MKGIDMTILNEESMRDWKHKELYNEILCAKVCYMFGDFTSNSHRHTA
jgi:hypothetical protein